jgi:hypothetical protein
VMSYHEWRPRIIDAARNIASRDFQKEAWFPGGKVVSSPDELYQTIIEDLTFDLFLQRHSHELDARQLQAANELRSILQEYYDSSPRHPDPRFVLDDPKWDLVRHAADRFVAAFNGRPGLIEGDATASNPPK